MAETREELEGMTVPELRDLTEERGVDVSGVHLKADLVNILLVEEPPEAETAVDGPSPSPVDEAEMEAVLKEGWEKRTDGGPERYINRRDFKVHGAIVPVGVTRTLEEAYALETKRVG